MSILHIHRTLSPCGTECELYLIQQHNTCPRATTYSNLNMLGSALRPDSEASRLRSCSRIILMPTDS